MTSRKQENIDASGRARRRSIRLLLLAVAMVMFLAGAGAAWLMLHFGLVPAAGQQPTPGVTKTTASVSGLRAGMVDPKTGKKIKYWVAPMDPTYIRMEPGKSPMGMDLVPVYEDDGATKEAPGVIRIDPATMQNMGVRLARVRRQPLVKYIRAYGTVEADQTKLYEVNTKFAGWIEKLYVNFEGEVVEKGQPLFEMYSPELVTAQEEYLLALRQYTSLATSPYEKIRAGAKRLLEASRTRLRYWDLTEEQIKRLEQTGKTQKTITIYSPASGVVVRKKATEGRFFKAGKRMYKIADLSTVWVEVDVYEYELPWVREGMPAVIELPYLPGKKFHGKVVYIYPLLEAKSRTAKLRLEFPNPKYELKLDMYADIILKATLGKKSLVIPQEAVIDTGVRKLVFVALGDGRFEPREVKLGLEGNHHEFQVLSGLRAGEEIVVSAQFMLDSESRLREAIQKMLEPQGAGKSSAAPADLDLSGLTMESDGPAAGTHQH